MVPSGAEADARGRYITVRSDAVLAMLATGSDDAALTAGAEVRSTVGLGLQRLDSNQGPGG
jgi:hypothetical protein